MSIGKTGQVKRLRVYAENLFSNINTATPRHSSSTATEIIRAKPGSQGSANVNHPKNWTKSIFQQSEAMIFLVKFYLNIWSVLVEFPSLACKVEAKCELSR